MNFREFQYANQMFTLYEIESKEMQHAKSKKI